MYSLSAYPPDNGFFSLFGLYFKTMTRFLLMVSVFVSLFALFSCVTISFESFQPAGRDIKENLRSRIVNEAKTWIGVPYKFGGKSRGGVDCVGFVNCVLMNCLPDRGWESLSGYYNSYPAAPRFGIRPGDFVFFRIKGSIRHIGIYCGNEEFIHAPAEGQLVRIDKLEGFWAKTLAGARKLYESEREYITAVY